MPYNKSTSLWDESDQEKYFQKLNIHLQQQSGPHCVSTCLAMMANTFPETFQGKINTQDPISWSDSLMPFGMKLAYCPTDIRKLTWYIPELLRLDDLFLLCYYTSLDPATLLGDPNEEGWICGSHVVVLHRRNIFDPMRAEPCELVRHSSPEMHTKRIFRIVPTDHFRGL